MFLEVLREVIGAANISLGNKGTAGPDYWCQVSVKGKLRDAVFECKGSSTNGGVAAQIQAASDQVAPYKDRGILGIICAACVPPIGAPGRPCLYLSDPLADEFDASPFQPNIASLAAAIGWAGEPGLAHELASTVISFAEPSSEEGGSTYIPESMTFEHLQGRSRTLSRSLRAVAERAAPRTVLAGDRGRLSVRLPVDNIQRLAQLLEQGPKAATEFRVRRTEERVAEPSDYTSVAPDGSAMFWQPNQA